MSNSGVLEELRQLREENKLYTKLLISAALSLILYQQSYLDTDGEEEVFDIAQALGYDGEWETARVAEWLKAYANEMMPELNGEDVSRELTA